MRAAQTLCSLSPIFILPFAVWFEKERIGFRAILGATVAVCGSSPVVHLSFLLKLSSYLALR